MPGSRFLIGIDLGTSNCAVAYVDTRARTRREALATRTWDIPQLVAPGDYRADGERELPSAIYLPRDGELPEGALALPWDPGCRVMVGSAARTLGERCPDQLVASSKSWLSHPRIDRRARILPWGDVSPDIAKMSCIDAARTLLAHIARAWNHVHARHKDAAFEAQQIALAVPASFDEAARALTVEAARAAGLVDFALIEEPQAAFYAWLAEHRLRWSESLAPGQLVLVCDVGGGTTDFSLFAVGERDGALAFERVAVGPHLLLGGDNLDLALARSVEARWRANGEPELDARDLATLAAQCRRAKERLLGDDPPDRVPVQLAGRSSRLIAHSRSAELVRGDVLALALDGFLPAVPLEPRADAPRRGLVEWGLPFEADAAITRHLAHFLCRASHGAAPVRPDLVLFQGGFWAPPLLRRRLAEVVGGWFGPTPLPELASADLARSVALGAAYYGLVRRGAAIAIRGGTSRAYYVGLEGSSRKRGPRAICLAPRGLESHATVRLDRHPLVARTGQRVRFSFFASADRDDLEGALVDAVDLEALAPLQTRLDGPSGASSGEVPVVLEAALSEVGTLELALVARKGGRRHVLELDVRGEGVASETAAVRAAPPGDAGAQLPGALALRDGDTAPVAVPGASAPSSTPASVAAGAVATDGGSPAIAPGAPAPVAADRMGSATGSGARPAPEARSASLDSLPAARALIEGALGGTEERAAERLAKALEDAVGATRREWPLELVRALAPVLLDGSAARTRSAAHELRWLNLTGFCLRPGTGHAADPDRIRRLWPFVDAGPRHERDARVRCEWWVMWRRVALGLSAGQQAELAKPLVRILTSPDSVRGRELASRAGKGERIEVLRLASSLELAERGIKETVGAILLGILESDDETAPQAAWCLGRLGARAPLGNAVHAVLGPAAVARWADALSARELGADEAFALASIARLTGDRARDLPAAQRDRIADRLDGAGYAPEAEMVRVATALDTGQRQRAFGEALPEGLVMK